MPLLLAKFREYLKRPALVRPMALAGPVLVLLVALPLLRPLRHAGNISDDEAVRLASIRAMVETGTLALDHPPAVESAKLIRANDTYYSGQPPVFAVLLSGPAWVLDRSGYSLADDVPATAYVLTLLGVTLPVAFSCGLIYRMGRLFELPRPQRVLLGIATVFGGGLISYAVVLNPHAPAACLLIGAAGCLIHVERHARPSRSGAWLALAGFCASLATTLDPSAGVIAVMFVLVILATRFTLGFRIGGMLLFVVGALAPLALHAAYTVPVTGDWRAGAWHPELIVRPNVSLDAALNLDLDLDDDSPISMSLWVSIGQTLNRLLGITLGSHGLFSHFPVALLGFAGVLAVMHRHWPTPVKILASAAGIGAIAIVLRVSLMRDDWSDAMFGNRWFVVFLPLLIFWSGAWARRKHEALGWAVAGVLVMFSSIVSILGATNPYPREGYDAYTARAALRQLIQPSAGTDDTRRSPPRSAIVAG